MGATHGDESWKHNWTFHDCRTCGKPIEDCPQCCPKCQGTNTSNASWAEDADFCHYEYCEGGHIRR